MALFIALDVTGLSVSSSVAGSVFFARRRLSDNLIWNGSTYEAPAAANVANYRITAAEQAEGATKLACYTATDPDPTTPGYWTFCTQAGTSVALTDLRAFRSSGSAAAEVTVASAVWSINKSTVAALATTTLGRWLYDTIGSIYAAVTNWLSMGSGSASLTPLGDPITIVKGDDYTPQTGRTIDFSLENGPELSDPAVPLMMGVGHPTSGEIYWTQAGEATRISATVQKLSFPAPRSKTDSQQAPATLEYSVEAQFPDGGAEHERTLWLGVCNSKRKYV